MRPLRWLKTKWIDWRAARARKRLVSKADKLSLKQAPSVIIPFPAGQRPSASIEAELRLHGVGVKSVPPSQFKKPNRVVFLESLPSEKTVKFMAQHGIEIKKLEKKK